MKVKHKCKIHNCEWKSRPETENHKPTCPICYGKNKGGKK